MERLSIDEVIGHCERKVQQIEKMFRREHLESENCGIADIVYKEYWEHRQLTEWLEELKTFKSDGFTQDLLNIGYTKGYRAAIDEFVERMKEKWIESDDLSISSEFFDFVEEIAEEMRGAE